MGAVGGLPALARLGAVVALDCAAAGSAPASSASDSIHIVGGSNAHPCALLRRGVILILFLCVRAGSRIHRRRPVSTRWPLRVPTTFSHGSHAYPPCGWWWCHLAPRRNLE